ncbi:hypothetical protein K461DRAFT_272959 [Myriangium duriaei CBS 260.36]|uniref:DUF7707 domain-containing protein n=1 Tax=Myriangium duriaei CBS 260.36 TaxID=1168546 RepID=A0A9P4ML24_9PEZI|nr:hypothetical protein K461DRAFT_272959 [Myriangium duriaei CBS 260.36]
MFYSSMLLAVTAMTGLVAAQSSITIDPNSVDSGTRSGWCEAERNTCSQICGSVGTTANLCDPTQLTYTCTCNSNTQPNISAYAQTLPSFICQTSVNQCIAANTNNQETQAACRDVVCGNQTVNAASTATSSATGSSSQTSGAASASTTGATSTSASGGSSATSASASATASKSAGMAVAMARDYGMSALVMGMLAAFGLAM